MTTQRMQNLFVAALAASVVGLAHARLPAPSAEAQAAAALAAHKAAWSDKVASYQLCKAQDRVAALVLAQARSTGKPLQPSATPACGDPGQYEAAPVKPIEAAGAHSPAATAISPPSTKQPDAVAKPATKP